MEPSLGRMDLGCAVLRASALRPLEEEEGGEEGAPLTFSQALPSPAAPEHWHDAGEAQDRSDRGREVTGGGGVKQHLTV